MASCDQDELDDSFEIEFHQLPGSSLHAMLPFWRARHFEARATSDERRRRYSFVAALVAVVCLVFINSVDLSGFFPADLPLVSSALSGGGLTAHGSSYSWYALPQRPLHLPTLAKGAACPVTPQTKTIIQLQTITGIGDSTVFVSTQGVDAQGVQHAVRGSFAQRANTYRGELVTWNLRLPDVEPVLIRGAQLDGPNILRFDGGIEQPKFNNSLLEGRALPELLISSDPSHGAPVAAWLSITRVPASGCYAYQIDAPATSMVLVFKVVVQQ